MITEHHYTLNECYYTEPSVFPSDWDSGGPKTMEKNWRIQFYFYDPNHKSKHPNGKLVVVKGMNSAKNLQDRRDLLTSILNREIEDLENGWNPIDKVFMSDEEMQNKILHSNLNFIEAFKIAATKIKASDNYLKEIDYCIARIEKAAKKLKLHRRKIAQLKRGELKAMLERCNLTAEYYNKNKTFLSTLFNELVEYDCCETNLTRDIRKKKIVKKVRDVISQKDLKRILNHLKKENPPFYIYARIFMMSGARSTELLKVRREDVDLQNQEYKVNILKGSQQFEVIKVIIPDAVPYWTKVINNTKPKEYLFSKNLKPGTIAIDANQITRRWKRWVKDKLDIEEDFYTLKHAFLDSLPKQEAQLLASHTHASTTSIYRTNEKKREREILKNIHVK